MNAISNANTLNHAVSYLFRHLSSVVVSVSVYIVIAAVLDIIGIIIALHHEGYAQGRLTASSSVPPELTVAPRKPELVELVRLDSTIKLDIRYATPNNFVGRALYREARAFLQRPAAEALVRAHRALKKYGYGILVFDGYRPWHITKLFREAVRPEHRRFVADPRKGSVHNRGCAVDVSLFSLADGKEVPMPSEFDAFDERAALAYTGGTSEQRDARALLHEAMRREGFRSVRHEWWHFDYKDWREYPVMDISFADIRP
jgi:D-alanyl-D-alanine dipeptidase